MSAAAAGGAADHAAKVQIGVQIGAGPKAVDAAKAGRGARAVIAAQATTWIGAEPRVGVAARLAPAVSQNLDPDPEGGLACAVRAERGVRAGVAVEVLAAAPVPAATATTVRRNPKEKISMSCRTLGAGGS